MRSTRSRPFVRKLLRSREVNDEIRDGRSSSGIADPLASLISKAIAEGKPDQIKALKAAQSALIAPKADPKKGGAGGGADSGAGGGVKIPRDKKTGRILKWVAGLDLCACVDQSKSDGKHLIRDCKFGSKGVSDKFKYDKTKSQ